MWDVGVSSHQVVDLVEELVHLLAVHQPDVTLAQQSPHLALQLHLVHVHHDHDRHQVVQHCGQQPVLVMLQPLALCFTQRVVPATHIIMANVVHIILNIFILHYNICYYSNEKGKHSYRKNEEVSG